MKDEIIATGIEGLDSMLGGGLPKGSCIMVIGGPGSGKTVFGTQFLWNGISKFNENGVMLTMEEDLEKFKRAMSKFGFNLQEYENKKLKTIDHSFVTYLSKEEYNNVIRYLTLPAFKITSLIDVLKKSVKEVNAKRIVIDSLSALMFQEPDMVKRRIVTRLIFNALRETACNSLVISEIKTASLDREFVFEEYLADGVIVMQNYRQEGTLIRGIHIEKMRGIAHDVQSRPYTITDHGITVFPSEKLLI